MDYFKGFSRYSMNSAHKTLPFGTKIHVTNEANNRTVRILSTFIKFSRKYNFQVDVIINDRGPGGTARILDLTWAAFGRIEDWDKGVTPCHYSIISSKPNDTENENNETIMGEVKIL